MPDFPCLILATGNLYKVEELKPLLAGVPVVLKGLKDFPEAACPDVEETGATFAENARQKALAYAARLPYIVLAEDSGLCVDALGGAPGVLSARFGEVPGGPALTDKDRNAPLLQKLAGVTHRRAHYFCAMCLVQGERVLAEVSGQVDGEIALSPQGEGGFGYDPLFVPQGHEQTFGQLPAAVKAAISHRARAAQSLAACLQRLVA